ncbi:hypothetical protein [Amycolatopsis minnesotensis]|uniref:Uncharacterized protein n=1 Tax=Amycolatopsis minnesotensis TaxID=337894 RepID=A0ABN2SC19_9PSEU
MTDLGELKSALAGTEPDDGFRPPDLAKIMADGGRIRRRRRIAVGTGAVALTAVVLFGISSVTMLRQPDSAPPALSVAKQPDAPVYEEAKIFWAGDGSPDGRPFAMSFLHEVRPGTEDHRFPDGYFISAGRSGPDGTPKRDRTVPVDLTPGFHRIDGVDGFSCGYFVAPFGKETAVRSIQAAADGKYADAKTAQWEAVPNIVLFWFPAGPGPAQIPGHRLEAYDAKGKLTVG